ncbi:MAG: GxxExxY protein [Parcubacteria group bacterium]
MNNDKIIYPELSYKIYGILFAAHNEVGGFCNEKQCCDCIERLLKENHVEYEREMILPPFFKGEKEGRNRIDFLIKNGDEKIILEIKSKTILTKEDYYQIKRYLTATNVKLGILVNFRSKYLVPKRIINSLS